MCFEFLEHDLWASFPSSRYLPTHLDTMLTDSGTSQHRVLVDGPRPVSQPPQWPESFLRNYFFPSYQYQERQNAIYAGTRDRGFYAAPLYMRDQPGVLETQNHRNRLSLSCYLQLSRPKDTDNVLQAESTQSLLNLLRQWPTIDGGGEIMFFFIRMLFFFQQGNTKQLSLLFQQLM